MDTVTISLEKFENLKNIEQKFDQKLKETVEAENKRILESHEQLIFDMAKATSAICDLKKELEHALKTVTEKEAEIEKLKHQISEMKVGIASREQARADWMQTYGNLHDRVYSAGLFKRVFKLW